MNTSPLAARITGAAIACTAIVGLTAAGLSTAHASDVAGVTEVPSVVATTTPAKPTPTPSKPAPAPAPVKDVAAKAVAFAKQQLGNPYKEDAYGWNAWGSMGLVWMSYKEAGHDLGTKDAYSLWNAGKRFDFDKRQSGDIILFELDGKARPALVSTDKNLLITAYPGKGVIEVPIFDAVKKQRVIRPTVKP